MPQVWVYAEVTPEGAVDATALELLVQRLVLLLAHPEEVEM